MLQQVNKKKKHGGNGGNNKNNKNKSTNLRKTRRHSATTTKKNNNNKNKNKNKNKNPLTREINETDEMYRGRLEFIQLNQGKTSNNKSKNTNNKNKSASLEDIVNYSKVWLYKTFYHCTYSPEMEKKFQSFKVPIVNLNH